MSGDDQGFLFADKPGGTVEITLADGKTKKAFPDGALAMRGEHPESQTPDWIGVKIGADSGSIEGSHFVFAADIHPDPKLPDYALVLPSVGCGDYCHVGVWLAHGLVERWRLADSAVNPASVWSADGGKLYLGLDGSAIVVEVKTGKVLATFTDFTAPALAPDGTLYLRQTEDFGIYKVDPTGKPVLVKKVKKPKVDEGEYPPGPEPVTFDKTGAPVAND